MPDGGCTERIFDVLTFLLSLRNYAKLVPKYQDFQPRDFTIFTCSGFLTAFLAERASGFFHLTEKRSAFALGIKALEGLQIVAQLLPSRWAIATYTYIYFNSIQ